MQKQTLKARKNGGQAGHWGKSQILAHFMHGQERKFSADWKR